MNKYLPGIAGLFAAMMLAMPSKAAVNLVTNGGLEQGSEPR